MLAEPLPFPGAGARHALVLSGGGARGAFEVGVMKALFAGASPVTGGLPLSASIFTGTSVGAYNAAFLAQEGEPGPEAVRRLEEIWRTRIASSPESCGNGVFRLRGNPLRLLDPGCWRQPFAGLADLGRDAAFWSGYALTCGRELLRSDSGLLVRALEAFNLAALFSREPLESLLRDTIDPHRLLVSPCSLAVPASDWKNGRAEVFFKSDVGGRLGTDILLASAAIPGIFPPVDLDGTPFVDGGLLMNTPLRPAIVLGADVLHAVYVDPELSAVPFPPCPNTLDTFYRLYSILLAEQLNQDARFIATINEEMAMLDVTAARGRELPAVRVRRAMAGETIPELEDRLYRPLVVHRYRPSTDLGGAEGFLSFDREVIARLIHQGYDTAARHDCAEARCVVLRPPLQAREQPAA